MKTGVYERTRPGAVAVSFPEQWNSVRSAYFAGLLLAALRPASLQLPRRRSNSMTTGTAGTTI